MRTVLVGLLCAYRFAISPLYGQVCRYHPSCSAYALEAVQTHGAARGSWLAVRRIGRCHPWAAGGIDHVPGSAGERRYLQTERETDGPAAAPVAAAVPAATRQGV